MWNQPGDGYTQTKNAGYGGGKVPAKKRNKPNTWCWTHGITYHNTATCKSSANGRQKTAMNTNMLCSQLCGIIQEK